MLKKLLLFLVVVVGLSALALFVVAKTGLAEVPVMTETFYTTPTPDHTVEAGTAIEEEMQTQLVSALQTKLQAGTITDANVSLIFSESTLTAGLREAILQGAQEVFVAERAQVAVVADGAIELYVPLVRNNEASAILLRGVPTVSEGKVEFDITRLQVGQLTWPGWLHAIVQAPVDRLVAQLNTFLEDYASLSAITATEGNVYLDGTMTLDLNTLIEQP